MDVVQEVKPKSIITEIKTKKLTKKEVELGFVTQILKRCLDGFDTLSCRKNSIIHFK